MMKVTVMKIWRPFPQESSQMVNQVRWAIFADLFISQRQPCQQKIKTRSRWHSKFDFDGECLGPVVHVCMHTHRQTDNPKT